MAERRLFEDIAEKIADMVRAGEFSPGSRLPGERELSERLGASRVTIREAEIALQARGLLRIRAGSGVYVCDPKTETGDELPSVSAFELTEARSLFESEAAALAAPIISDADLAKLDALLAVMAEDSGDEERSTAADREFHMTIAAASSNRVIIHTVQTLWKFRMEVPQVRLTHESVCHHDGAARQDEHAAIVEALRRRDAKGARQAMRLHFSRLLEAMLDATEKQERLELEQKTAQSRSRFLMSAQLV
jgi:GntR family hexuronate regulon transcriptional repressor